MNTSALLFDPLLAWPLLAGLAGLAFVLVILAWIRRLSGWPLRLAAFTAALAALANPVLQSEDRDPLPNIVLAIIDETESQGIAPRADQTALAIAELTRKLDATPNTELRIQRLDDSPDNAGTALMQALTDALANVPPERLAGVFLISDGQIHDAERAPALPAPVHQLMTGEPDEWDRRLKIVAAPAYAILGETVELTVRIEDQGMLPDTIDTTATLTASVDGETPFDLELPIGEDITFSVSLSHAGVNIIHLSLPPQPGELTDRNNDAVIQINGIRDRLQVLLVSGEPYAGGRTWRNLLKSDSAVDLVHFTILRPPEKFDGVPVDELSLIAFPTRELFVEKIEEFDLIIFDRYRRRGLLPGQYFENIRDYVSGGGAILVTTGPEFASANSIFYSALGEILPVVPSSQVIEEGYLPRVTDVGRRHPVTENLGDDDASGTPPWGRWMRQIEMTAPSGHVAMTGVDGAPLLVLDRVVDGRVAVLASDQAWLWSRGFEGGGPQLELLRRLAHWLMKEPELEEDALQVRTEGQSMTITRRSIDAMPDSVTVTGPDGTRQSLALSEVSPGKFAAQFSSPLQGLFRIEQDGLFAVAALGPAAPREFEETIATAEKLAPYLRQQGGADFRLYEGVPELRWVTQGRPTAGNGWAGLIDRQAFVSTSISLRPVLPVWAWLLLAAGLTIAAWLREGRR